MKKNIIITVAILAGIGLSALSQASTPGITASKHDLSTHTGTSAQLCVVCHTPHNADVSTTTAPLWNHTATTATYTLYNTTTSPTLNAVTSQPTGVSKLCLSCHDGTVAPDSYTGHTGTMATLTETTGGFGTTLNRNHPISFTFDASLVTADGDLKLPPSGWVNNGKFECSSCHDVHNKMGNSAMLHIENTGSALCLSCHTK